jgi:phytoene dehydrogenase-like protein
VAEPCDVTVVGAGVNGLVCALVLARSGLTVQVLDDKPAAGGILRAEFPFAKAPRLGTYAGAHRLGFVPEQLAEQIDLKLPLAPRDPSLFVPTKAPGRYLLASAGHSGLRAAAGGVVSERDTRALEAMHAELDAMVEDLKPAWFATPMALEEVAERFVRPALRAAFVRLCRGTFAEYAARFGIQSGLVKAVLAADALGRSFASWDSPGSGAPLLVRHAAGAEPIAKEGRAALLRALLDAVKAAGVSVVSNVAVTQILVKGNTVTSYVTADGVEHPSGVVVASSDPWRLRALVGADRLPADYTRRLEGLLRPGGVAKLSIALGALPRFACLPGDHGQHRATTFLLPHTPDDEDDAVRALGRAFADASAGRLPIATPLECTFPTAIDPALQDVDGRHSASIAVPWAPYDLAGTTWAAEEERLTAALLDTLEQLAPGARELVVETTLHHPKKLEAHFGITRGQLAHVDDTVVFGDRLSPAVPISGLYMCGQGTGPAASIFGVAGVNAARRVVADLELALEQTDVGYLDR